MNYLIGMPVVNRFELAERALNSIPERMRGNVIVLDNSPRCDFCTDNQIEIRVNRPWVPQSYTQSMNYFRAHALSMFVQTLFVMHSDAVAPGGTFETVLSMIEGRTDRWGAMFTNYDALVAYNAEALNHVGEWDTVFWAYFSDNDYYRRMRLKGWKMVETNLPVQHDGSQTINSDPELRFLNSVTFPLYREYYVRKWGGDPGHETFERPFNR